MFTVTRQIQELRNSSAVNKRRLEHPHQYSGSENLQSGESSKPKGEQWCERQKVNLDAHQKPREVLGALLIYAAEEEDQIKELNRPACENDGD
jgi:hypothetical protein